MSDDLLIMNLVQQAFDSGRTLEDVCNAHPRLLTEVRRCVAEFKWANAAANGKGSTHSRDAASSAASARGGPTSTAGPFEERANSRRPSRRIAAASPASGGVGGEAAHPAIMAKTPKATPTRANWTPTRRTRNALEKPCFVVIAPPEVQIRLIPPSDSGSAVQLSVLHRHVGTKACFRVVLQGGCPEG